MGTPATRLLPQVFRGGRGNERYSHADCRHGEGRVDPDLIGRTAAALADRTPIRVPDEEAERRRAADRARKRLRKSAETAEEVSPQKETSPTPPKE